MRTKLSLICALILGLWSLRPDTAEAQTVTGSCSAAPSGQGTGTICSATMTVGDGPSGTTSTGTGGHSRTFKYYVPSGVGTGKPLIFVLHGGTQNADGAMSSTNYEWNLTADSKKYVVVYPEGKPQSDDTANKNWNDCRAKMTTANDGGIDPANSSFSDWDDVTFVSNILNYFQTATIAPDMGRVFVTGASNGGLMTLRLARQSIASRFRSFGPTIAANPVKDECPATPAYTPASSVTNVMTFTYSSEDQLMPPNGGCVSAPFEAACGKGSVQSATTTIAYYRSWLGIASNAGGTVTNVADTNTADGDYGNNNLTCSESSTQFQTDYRSTSSVSRLRVIRVNGAGHTAPGNTQVDFLTKNTLKVGCRNLDRSAVVYLLSYWGL
jgi:poly(3-hydroxybutyrate) depolymerase